MKFNVYEAKAQFSSLIDMALVGKEVIIAKSGKPVARIVPLVARTQSRSGVKLGGLNKAKLKLTKDFYRPMSDADLLGT